MKKIHDMYLNLLGKYVDVIVDRPIGSLHPRNKDLEYKLNYGYIPNTKAEDNSEIDVYILDEKKPVEKYKGKIIAIIYREDDVECKLVASNSDESIDNIKKATYFVEQFYKSKILCLTSGCSGQASTLAADPSVRRIIIWT